MLLEAASPHRAAITERIAPAWRMPLLRLAIAWAAILALFAADWAVMVNQWWNISTFNHILLVPVIIGWLVWQRSPELAKLVPQAWGPGLLMVTGAMFAWLLGDISGTATVSHLALVMVLQASVVTLFGPRVAWALLFPLAFGLFLVPVGEELVPALQMITAHITIALTHASGIPAAVEGVFIDTPVGLFEVAEACSGVKFLIAMVALGTLVAHVCFLAWRRRAVFMVVAVVLPILANGVRAWGTIYIAQSQGIAFAAGFDHIVYGWIFFALVMAALLAAGWKFFDRQIGVPFIDAATIRAARWPGRLERWNGNGWFVMSALVVAAVVHIAWAAQARSVEAALPDEIGLVEIEGWEPVALDQSYPWHPRATGYDHRLITSYRDRQGRVVDVIFALYAAQEEGREAGGYGEGALPSDTEWRWLSANNAPAGASGVRLQALGTQQRVAYTWYRHDEWTGSSRLRLKLLNMRDRLLSVPQPTMMLIVSAEDTSTQDGETVLADFLQSTAPVSDWMDALARLD
ncbi:exosortase A [Aurantiacibacter odishensis]|uniref:exosortase A n=1 Tax=Aurantiacibacter odishensis TaxID=1155476 RepID=UPI000E76480E|nr:exosortase A [Aurantiacibacter odishensis]